MDLGVDFVDVDIKKLQKQQKKQKKKEKKEKKRLKKVGGRLETEQIPCSREGYTIAQIFRLAPLIAAPFLNGSYASLSLEGTCSLIRIHFWQEASKKSDVKSAKGESSPSSQSSGK